MNRNLTIGLVIVFVALLLYVLLVQRPAQEAQANATPTPATVATTSGALWEGLTADQILSVTVTGTEGEVAFGRASTSEPWAITAPEAQPADQLLAAQNAATVVNLRYSNIITTTTDLALFGVISPTYQIQVTLTDGTSRKLLVGDKTPLNTGYYALRDSETNALVLASTSVEAIVGWLDNPPILAPTPDPNLTLTPALTPTP